jgi:hypothetical protein
MPRNEAPLLCRGDKLDFTIYITGNNIHHLSYRGTRHLIY